MNCHSTLLPVALLSVVAGLYAGSAAALTATFFFPTPSVTDGSGSLDISPYLGGIPTFASVSLDFSFSAPINTSSSLVSTTGSGRVLEKTEALLDCIPVGCFPSFRQRSFYTTTTTDFHVSQIPTATVSVSDNPVSAAAPLASSVLSVVSVTEYVITTDLFGNESHDRMRFSNDVSAYGGSFGVTTILNDIAVTALNATGRVGFDLLTVGGVQLDSVAFSANYAFGPQPAAAAPVPLPAALPIFGSALGMVGLFHWRRKNMAAV